MFRTKSISIGLIAVVLFSASVLALFSSMQFARAQNPEFIIIRDSTLNDADDFKELTVTCPEDMIAVAGGAGIFYDSGEIIHLRPVLISNFSYPDENSWFAEAIQPKEGTTDWYLEVHATCVTP